MPDLPWTADVITPRPIAELIPYAKNSRTHSTDQINQLARGMQEFGFTVPVLIDEAGGIIAGHGRVMAAKQLKLKTVPTITARGWSDEQKRAYVIWDNQSSLLSGWDDTMLRAELGDLKGLGFDLSLSGFGALELNSLFASANSRTDPEPLKVTLADRFGVPPFSVLNAREGWWQDRKRAWLALGIRSEVGRGENLLKMSDTMLQPDPEKRAKMANGKRPAAAFGQDLMRGEGGPDLRQETASLKGGLTHGLTAHPYDGGSSQAGASGTSIFDPVLCELLYRWFCPPGGMIMDPFSGGSVRGIVAGKLGRRYQGTDLRAEQVEANRVQGDALFGPVDLMPKWYVSDAMHIESVVEGEADFVFSCPPYADLEVYSDDPRDLSTMPYDAFVEAYRQIIAATCRKLKNDRFAAFVVGDVRGGKDGAYRGFVRDTELAFEAAGVRLYNEAILVTSAGSLPIRAGKQFESTRKLGKTHQNVLIFVKGDPRKATKAIGKVQFGDMLLEEKTPEEQADRPDSDYGEVI